MPYPAHMFQFNAPGASPPCVHCLHALHSAYPIATFLPIYVTTCKSPTLRQSSLRPVHPALRIKLTIVSSFVQSCSFGTSGR